MGTVLVLPIPHVIHKSDEKWHVPRPHKVVGAEFKSRWGNIKGFWLRSDNYSLAKYMVLLNISNIKDIVLSVIGNTKVNKMCDLCTNFWSCCKADVKNKWLQLVLSIYSVPGPVLSVLSAFWVFHSWFFYLYEVEITDFFLQMEKLEVQRGQLICPKFSQLVCVRVMISLRLVIPKPEILTFVHCKP